MGIWQATNQMRVAEAYEITSDRCLAELGDLSKAEPYDPWHYPAVASELARVKPGDISGALRFVEKWGLLCGPNNGKRRGKEPFSWIESHACTARFIIQLVNLIGVKPSEGQLDASQIDRWIDEKWAREGIEISAVLFSEQEREIQEANTHTGMFRAGSILKSLITYRISDTHLDYSIDADGKPKESVTGERLLDIVYAHLGAYWTGKSGYYMCAYRDCDVWSPTPRDGKGAKPKYCPPEMGEGESLCSRRERHYRNYKPKSKRDAAQQYQEVTL